MTLDLLTPSLGAADVGEIIGLVVFLLYGAFWLIQRLAESRSAKNARGKETGPAEQATEEREVYVADGEALQKFLQGLSGREAQPKPQPEQAPKPRETATDEERPVWPESKRPARFAPKRPPRPVPAMSTAESEEVEGPTTTLVTLTPTPPAAALSEPQEPEPPPEAAVPVDAPSMSSPPPMELSSIRRAADARAPAERRVRAPAERLQFPHLSTLQRAYVWNEVFRPRRRPSAPIRQR